MCEKKGFTIIECLLSILVLAIMLTAGMAFYLNAQASMGWSIHKRIALEMASAELENIKNNGYPTIPAAPAGNLWRGPLAVTVGDLSGQKYIYVYDISAGSGVTDYKKVHVVVSWQDSVKNVFSNVSLDTYIAP